MKFLALPRRGVAVPWLIFSLAGVLRAQEHPVQRLANIVSVAVSEYAKGVDGRGRVIAADEYSETLGFLTEARNVAGRLPTRGSATLALLDTIIASVQAKRPPVEVAAIERRFAESLGSEAKLGLPDTALDPLAGQRVYASSCASCHGPRAGGDGPMAATLRPRPPALADARLMRANTPELMYRKVTIGVMGTAMPAFGDKLSSRDRWNVVAYLTELRNEGADIPLGEGLYTQSCAACHGANGTGDGPLARGLS